MSSDPHALAIKVLHREINWREDLARLEQMATAQPLPAWWSEAGAGERTRFLADFLELYLGDPVFTSAIDTLLGRAN